MKIKKYLTLCFIGLLCAICMFGCAKVELIRAYDSGSVILDRLVVTLDKSALDKSGVTSYAEVRESVLDDMENFVNYANFWKASFQENYNDVYLGLEAGLHMTISPATDNELSLTIQFDSPLIFATFYGLADIEDVEYEKAVSDIGPFISKMLEQDYSTEQFGLFLYKYSMVSSGGIMTGLKDFKTGLMDKTYYEKYREMLKNKYDLNDLEITQIFGLPDDRIYSNADEKEVVKDMTFLYWDLTGKDDDFQMSIYKIAPKTAMWYALGVVISAIFVIILFVVIKYKHSKDISVRTTKQEVEKNE